MLELNKNLLINGQKIYSQRLPYSTATPTTSYQYLSLDRWCQKITGSITSPVVSYAVDFPYDSTKPSTKFPWCSKYTGITSANSALSEQQRIEGDFGLELIGDYVSFLGYVTSTSYQTATVNIGSATSKDNHSNQITLYTKIFTITTDDKANELKWPKIAQFDSLISSGIFVEIVLSNPLNTSTSSTHRFGGMSLVRGRYTPSETLLAARNQIEELSYCLRYYEKSYDLGVIPGTVSSVGYIGNTAVAGTGGTWVSTVHFKMLKRITPVMSLWSPWGASANTADREGTASYPVAASASYVGLSSFRFFASPSIAEAKCSHFSAASEL